MKKVVSTSGQLVICLSYKSNFCLNAIWGPRAKFDTFEEKNTTNVITHSKNV